MYLFIFIQKGFFQCYLFHKKYNVRLNFCYQLAIAFRIFCSWHYRCAWFFPLTTCFLCIYLMRMLFLHFLWGLLLFLTLLSFYIHVLTKIKVITALSMESCKYSLPLLQQFLLTSSIKLSGITFLINCLYCFLCWCDT